LKIMALNWFILLLAQMAKLTHIYHNRVSVLIVIKVYFSMALPGHSGPRPCIQFCNNLSDGRTPWTGDHLVIRPLPKHRTTQTE
jgi:hypothetical protein